MVDETGSACDKILYLMLTWGTVHHQTVPNDLGDRCLDTCQRRTPPRAAPGASWLMCHYVCKTLSIVSSVLMLMVPLHPSVPGSSTTMSSRSMSHRVEHLTLQKSVHCSSTVQWCNSPRSRELHWVLSSSGTLAAPPHCWWASHTCTNALHIRQTSTQPILCGLERTWCIHQ